MAQLASVACFPSNCCLARSAANTSPAVCFVLLQRAAQQGGAPDAPNPVGAEQRALHRLARHARAQQQLGHGTVYMQ